MSLDNKAFLEMMAEQKLRVDARIERLSQLPFTDEEAASLQAMLWMGADEGSCIYGDSTEEEAKVLIGRAMRILENANK